VFARFVQLIAKESGVSIPICIHTWLTQQIHEKCSKSRNCSGTWGIIIAYLICPTHQAILDLVNRQCLPCARAPADVEAASLLLLDTRFAELKNAPELAVPANQFTRRHCCHVQRLLDSPHLRGICAARPILIRPQTSQQSKQIGRLKMEIWGTYLGDSTWASRLRQGRRRDASWMP